MKKRMDNTPDYKDIQRAHGLIKSGKRTNSNGSPVTSAAIKMARAITDIPKLVRRSSAVAAVWGTSDYEGERNGIAVTENMWKPFALRLEEMGFTYSEIVKISEYTHDKPEEILGIEDLFF